MLKLITKFNNELIIPVDNRINPGFISNSDNIKEYISLFMYNGFKDIFNKISLNPSIRCVWMIGDIDDNELNRCKSLHHLQNQLVIKLGRSLDFSNDPGIFKIL